MHIEMAVVDGNGRDRHIANYGTQPVEASADTA